MISRKIEKGIDLEIFERSLPEELHFKIKKYLEEDILLKKAPALRTNYHPQTKQIVYQEWNISFPDLMDYFGDIKPDSIDILYSPKGCGRMLTHKDPLRQCAYNFLLQGELKNQGCYFSLNSAELEPVEIREYQKNKPVRVYDFNRAKSFKHDLSVPVLFNANKIVHTAFNFSQDQERYICSMAWDTLPPSTIFEKLNKLWN